jgi:hypothetical protein
VDTYRAAASTIILAALLLGGPGPARAQSGPVMQGDVAASAGWLSVNWGAGYATGGRDWANSLLGTASAGWYWTDRSKTEIDFGASTTATGYAARPVVIDGRTSHVFIDSSVARRAVGIGQHHQFYRNTWFHPYVAAGASVAWQRVTDRVGPVFAYDEASRGGRLIEPSRTEGPRTETIVRPYVATGFKAYMTQRAFFRSDLRASFGRRLDEVSVRVGFGVDF